jgi:hypothetical protein
MRISAVQRIQNENRIRAAMDRLLRGELPPDGNGDIKTRGREASTAPPSTASDPTRTCAPEFEQRLQQVRRDGHTPNPKTAQIERLMAEVDKRKPLTQANTTIDQLTAFRTEASARLAAQHDPDRTGALKASSESHHDRVSAGKGAESRSH